MFKKSLLFLCIFFLLSGCKSSGPLITATDGAFSCTPQEFIDMMNDAIKTVNESQDEVEIVPIPDYQASGERIKVIDPHLSFYFSENENHQLDEVELWWFGNLSTCNRDHVKKVMSNAGFYARSLCTVFAPENADEIMAMIDSKEGTVYGYGDSAWLRKSITANDLTFEHSISAVSWNVFSIKP
jgi:hypothetical protein